VKEHVKRYSCEEAAKVTTIPAETIRRIAQEYGEAARIGSTIVIEGKELPYRPVCVYWRKGANQHKHSMLSGMAIQLMNIVVGAIDVPGGMIGQNARLLPGRIVNFSWGPTEGPDGMAMPDFFRLKGICYPAREVKRPETVNLFELYPVASTTTPLANIVSINQEKYQLPYKPEVLLHTFSNLMVNTVNPEQVEEMLKAFSFQVSFAYEIDETVEFADIVLPNTHYLETLSPIMSLIIESSGEKKGAGLGHWCFKMCQPAATPPPGARSSPEVLLELIERLGLRRDVYHILNVRNRLREPYKLDTDKQYTWPEIVDNWAKSHFGDEHDLAWFKEHGFLSYPKKVEEVYTTPFGKARIPVYAEHFIKAGEDVKRVTSEMGLNEWDVSDYQPIPDWKPCPAYEEESQDYDLYPVNYKAPFHNLAQTMNNIWLAELGGYNPYVYYILINRQTAQKKGIKDRDMIRLETETGNRVEGMAKVTACVHPEVVGIGGAFGGRWARGLPVARGNGVHYNRLIPLSLERMDVVTAAVDCCVKVKVSKVGEVKI
jgi:anaerobic selenocysteine-containing dehydrogenase